MKTWGSPKRYHKPSRPEPEWEQRRVRREGPKIRMLTYFAKQLRRKMNGLTTR